MGIGAWRDFKDLEISEWDEYLIHQVGAPIEKPGYDDPYFIERIIFCMTPPNAEGPLHIIAGGGVAPNLGIMQGFVCIRHGDVQRNIRASRYVKNDRARMEIGPLSYKVLEPLKRWEISLAENDYGIGCSLEFQGRVPPWPHPVAPQEQRDTGSDQLLVMHTHYDQLGYMKGTVTFEGQEFDAGGYLCVRDHTWSIRRPGWKDFDGIYCWVHAHFSDSIMHLMYFHMPRYGPAFGAGVFKGDDGSVIDIVDMRHRIHFWSTARDYTRWEFLLVDANGKERHLTATPTSSQLYMAGAGYDDRLTKDYGEPLHIEGERWDLSAPLGIEDHRFGMNQKDAQFQLDGEPGAGLIECCFGNAPDWKYEPTF